MKTKDKPRAVVTAHTPGPWSAAGTRITGTPKAWPTNPKNPGSYNKADAQIVADLECGDRGSYLHYPLAMVEANARLIAAAPELLAACKGMLEWARRVQQLNPGVEVANACNAIAKAEGRP